MQTQHQMATDSMNYDFTASLQEEYKACIHDLHRHNRQLEKQLDELSNDLDRSRHREEQAIMVVQELASKAHLYEAAGAPVVRLHHSARQPSSAFQTNERIDFCLYLFLFHLFCVVVIAWLMLCVSDFSQVGLLIRERSPARLCAFSLLYLIQVPTVAPRKCSSPPMLDLSPTLSPILMTLTIHSVTALFYRRSQSMDTTGAIDDHGQQQHFLPWNAPHHRVLVLNVFHVWRPSPFQLWKKIEIAAP